MSIDTFKSEGVVQGLESGDPQFKLTLNNSISVTEINSGTFSLTASTTQVVAFDKITAATFLYMKTTVPMTITIATQNIHIDGIALIYLDTTTPVSQVTVDNYGAVDGIFTWVAGS